jgi:hypothetical protein
MHGSNSKSGGCFLAICIIAGFFTGLAIGDPMKGVILGTAGGIVIALLLWLSDRRAR